MARRNSKLLVIDADVARASGRTDEAIGRAKACRDFLKEVRTICHRVVFTPDITEEWDEHQSRFARTWRVAMKQKGKTHLVEGRVRGDVQVAIENSTDDQGQLDAMEKDRHLLEAALTTDQTIVSMDDVMGRVKFGQQWAR